MNIHEYQAKELLSQFKVPVLKSQVVFSAEEAGKVTFEKFESQGSKVVVLKSQVHAGGRGKGIVKDVKSNVDKEIDGKAVRGVNVVHSGNLADKVFKLADATFGNKLVTIQTLSLIHI